MTNLVIDRGNTTTKVYIFSEGKIVSNTAFSAEQEQQLVEYVQSKECDAAILCSVQSNDAALTSVMKEKKIFIPFTYNTPTPLKLSYATPESLGPDRIAAALAGWQLSGGGNVLVVVAGTCITYNVVEANGTFVGGAISPGLKMRLQAMHHFTGKLPMVSMKGDFPLTANTTESSLRSGALNGAVRELSGMIASYGAFYSQLKTVISGGDGGFLAEALKNGIFARPELVAEGLNTILNYNVANRLAK
jgi:type III pantothenate kinase